MTSRRPRRTRPLLAVLGWLLAATAATTIGVLAIRAAGAGVVGTTTAALTQEQVAQALARSTPATSPSGQPAPTTSAGPQGVSRVLATPGGTIIARCTNGQASLQSWSPAQGYETEDVTPGPALTAGLTFETHDSELLVHISCATGTPTATTSTQPDRDNDND